MIEPKKCRFDSNTLCGVVKVVSNCPFHTEDQCKDANSEAWLGFINRRFNTLTLKRFRYNHQRINVKVLDVNMCSECRVIWLEPQPCPICKEE